MYWQFEKSFSHFKSTVIFNGKNKIQLIDCHVKMIVKEIIKFPYKISLCCGCLKFNGKLNVVQIN